MRGIIAHLVGEMEGLQSVSKVSFVLKRIIQRKDVLSFVK